MSLKEKRNQLNQQCLAIAHMAENLKDVYEDLSRMVDDCLYDDALDQAGESTHRIMEYLGEVLNSMDVVDEADDLWISPIFKGAREHFPVAPKEKG